MLTAVVRRAPDVRLQARAYLRMGRTIRYENWLGTPLWWTSLPAALATDGTTLLLVLLTLLAYMAMVAVAGTLDDVQGYRDGSDRINYERSDPTGRRPMTRKPLLLGWVTEAQAVRYAAIAAVGCCALVLASWLVGTAEPAWWLPASGLVLAAGSQYSSGLKLSYIGAQELLLAAVMISSVVFPFLLVAGHLPAMVTVTAAIFALWFVQVSMCSNSHDVDGDRSVGRRTLAALATETAYRRVVAATFGSTWALAATATVVGWWSPWQLVAIAPAAVLHAHQLRLFLASDPLHARAVGFLALRIGVVGLSLANLGVR